MALPKSIGSVSPNLLLNCYHRSLQVRFARGWIYPINNMDKGKDFPNSYTSRPGERRQIPYSEKLITEDLESMRHKYPDFLPAVNPDHRHRTKVTLEHGDMIKRRENLDVPEFYVGSILAVTVSDPFAPGKVSRFLGICIYREGSGLNSAFTLRNVIDREGIEIRYDLYNPTIRSIEAIKLEKRLDQDLRYLRDALPEYSTFPLDMEPEIRKEGAPIPINPIKVKLLPLPWSKDWFKIQYHRQTMGIEKFENVWSFSYQKSLDARAHNPYEHLDLMKEYREHIPEDQQLPIWQKLKVHEQETNEIRKKARRASLLKR